jgi:LCP family protein required for cell wall assembly
MTKRPWILWSVIIMVCVVIGFLGWRGWVFANHPLNTSQAELANLVATQPANLVATQPANLVATQPGQATGAENPTALPTPENYTQPSPMPLLSTPTFAPNASPICGGPPLMFILTAGFNNIDEKDNADAVRIARVDFTRPQVSMLALQRAIWVNIPYLESHNIFAMWFSSSYAYGEAFLGKGKGIYLLNQTIAENFGINSDHYAVVNLTSFENVVDTVGGVDIYLSAPVVDNVWQHIDLGVGWHHLDGETAMRFVRVRRQDTDWQRINRQTMVIQSLLTKLTSPDNLPKLPALALQVRDDIQTDLSPVEIGQLTCLAAHLTKDQVKFYEISQDMVIPTTLNDEAKSQIMLPKYDLIRPYIQQFINGTLP